MALARHIGKQLIQRSRKNNVLDKFIACVMTLAAGLSTVTAIGGGSWATTFFAWATAWFAWGIVRVSKRHNVEANRPDTAAQD